MRFLLFSLLLLALFSARSSSQNISGDNREAPKDTLPSFSLETIVITADRQENKIANTTSSVTAMNSVDLRHLPALKISDAIMYLPGFFVVNKDGLGREPIVSTRGFYGGGEAEYLLVLLDGRPINDLETGMVNWNIIPLRSISSIEISRGSSSPLYGDVALGGVMNILTNGLTAQNTTLSIEGGSYGIFNGQIRHGGMLGNNSYNLSLANERSDGFRQHSSWKTTTLTGGVMLPLNEGSRIAINVNGQWDRSDDPGPLTPAEANIDREQSSPYYKVDGKDENRQSISAEHRITLSTSSEFSTSIYYNRRKSDALRTFTTPAQLVDFSQGFNIIGLYDTTFYGDTKERDLLANEYGLNIKYSLDGRANSIGTRAIFGIDGSYGKLTSTYYNAFKGFQIDYINSNPLQGTMVSDGDASRGKFAFYSNIEQRFAIPLTISVGGRYDVLEDTYAGRLPDTNFSIHTNAVSLKYGANYKYVDADDFTGNVYVSYNRSFKAPTLDQLSDQRPIDAVLFAQGSSKPIPSSFPPFSNNALRPQVSSSYEVGLYQKLKLIDGIYTEHTLSYYKTDILDEIDFDLQSFRYRNIQNSRHVGIEYGLKVYVLPSISGFFNYTWSSVKFASGGNEGNYLKGIPRNVMAAGMNCDLLNNLQISLAWNFVNDTYMDDENTMLLGNFNTGSLKATYVIDRFMLFVDGMNIFNKSYNSTGYVEYGTPFYLPSAGRTIHAGISLAL
jgi:vitamin B12 transporter